MNCGCPACQPGSYGRELDLAADRDAWRARAEKAETRAYDAEAHADLFRESMVAAEARATQAEAQAAAMHDTVAKFRDRECQAYGKDGPACGCCDEIISALDFPDAGRTLLAELEALREVARVADKIEREVTWSLGGLLEELNAAMEGYRAVDAARKGET